MEEKKFIELLGQKGTVKILKTINNSEKCTFTDLMALTSSTTLYRRIKQLINLRLIKHNFRREKGKREEWYETTEKGKRVVQIIDKLFNAIKESE